MGLFKKIADYSGVTHGVDPTGHSHSTSESWLSTIVNSLQTAINGKASTDDLQGLENIVQGLEDSKADTVHSHSISDITGLSVALTGKSPLESTYFSSEGVVAAVECNPLGSGTPGVYASVSQGSVLSAIKLSIVEGSALVQIDGDSVFGNAIVDDLSESETDEEKLPTTGAVVTALAGKAAASHTQAISTITGLQSALDGKAAASHTQTISTITGLQSVLDTLQASEDGNLLTSDKTIVGAINEIHGIQGGVTEVDAGDGLELTNQTPFGKMYHIDNSMLSSKLNQIITTQEGGNNIHYHQGAGEMIADHFMIRVYRYDSEYFVEIAGAWDNIVPPQ